MKRHVLSVLVASFIGFGGASAGAQNPPQGDPPRTISVQGSGEVSVAADRAVIAIAVETTNARAQTAVAENAERSTRVAAAIRSLLAADDELDTTSYSLQPRYEHIKGETEPRITGYVASNEVRVTTRELGAVGKIVDAAIRAGANRIGSLQFTLADRNDAALRALEGAGRNARAQAEAIARSLGVKLGKISSANASGGGPIAPRRMETMAFARDSMPETPIEAGDVTVSATLHVVFEID